MHSPRLNLILGGLLAASAIGVWRGHPDPVLTVGSLLAGGAVLMLLLSQFLDLELLAETGAEVSAFGSDADSVSGERGGGGDSDCGDSGGGCDGGGGGD